VPATGAGHFVGSSPTDPSTQRVEDNAFHQISAGNDKARRKTHTTQKEPDEPGSPAENAFEIIGYEKVPRIKVAGPGTDGNQRANIVYFHITDNTYFGYEGSMARTEAGGCRSLGRNDFIEPPALRGRRFLPCLRSGFLPARSNSQSLMTRHVLEPDRIPRTRVTWWWIRATVGIGL
jgi:hypothetical protein